MPNDPYQGVSPIPWVSVSPIESHTSQAYARKPGIRVGGYIPWSDPIDFSQSTVRTRPGITFIWVPDPAGRFTDDMFEQEAPQPKVNLSDYLYNQSSIGPYPPAVDRGSAAGYIPDYISEYYT